MIQHKSKLNANTNLAQKGSYGATLKSVPLETKASLRRTRQHTRSSPTSPRGGAITLPRLASYQDRQKIQVIVQMGPFYTTPCKH